MLASTTRSVSRLARSSRTFATVVDSAGVKVAAVDYGQPTSAVTFLVKGGSRFETKPGVAHALKNFAFKSTGKRSALGTVRESELYGGVLSSTLSREHLALTAEFLRGDEEFFVDVLSSFITSAKYTRHEFEEFVLPSLEADSLAAQADPLTRALELAHTLAFRSGLGSSLFASPHAHLTHQDIQSYASSIFTKGNLAVLGTGIDQATLSKLVEKSLASLSASGAAPSTTPSSYFGGESRLENAHGPQTVFIGFGATGVPSAELAALSAHLSSTPSVKWSQGTSPVSAGIPEDASVQTVLLPYSDAALFGLIVQGATPEAVKEAAKVAVKALKEAAAPGGIKNEDFGKAVSKAKFQAASAIDSRDGLFSVLGAKVLAGSQASVDSTLTALDKLTPSAFSKTSSTLLKAKPTFVAVGDANALPFPDEVGL
ncbi:hypothetical protein JAAARDRAFT_133094 [Jaapia argillacea MUCL 33604]|uniref:Cytochrome b-c1 complex subunit 2, mitochondrial n=1 Tax=Jaapia argillacea MUCL 33604 TaxID=933084 RepID=A0A067PMM0_9AGAM|nr:hypothetical protein JAAARDRAFT_133094 [Jaapia argillacea MUCL 33604]